MRQEGLPSLGPLSPYLPEVLPWLPPPPGSADGACGWPELARLELCDGLVVTRLSGAYSSCLSLHVPSLLLTTRQPLPPASSSRNPPQDGLLWSSPPSSGSSSSSVCPLSQAPHQLVRLHGLRLLQRAYPHRPHFARSRRRPSVLLGLVEHGTHVRVSLASLAIGTGQADRQTPRRGSLHDGPLVVWC